MFRHIYEASAGMFVLQGALLVPLLLLAGVAWYRQVARLTAVAAALGRDRAQRDRTLQSLSTGWPTLTPLSCADCGGALALEVGSTICVSCRARFPPPADYSATLALRARLRQVTRAALLHWALARALTLRSTRWLLGLLIVGEPAIFGITLIGAASYADTRLDRLFGAVGEQIAMALMLAGFGGFVIWMVVFIMLAGLSREMRRQLPAFPVVARAGAATTEFATCRACGGGIHYDGRAFALLCGYCGVENYRAAFGRHARGEAEGAHASNRATLFGAMQIIEAFTGTFFVTTAILVTGFALLVIWIAVSD